jgi:nitroreductase
MQLMEAIASRRSVRAYAPEGIERAVVEKLIDAAIKAPNATNCQNWAFGIIQCPDKLRKYSARIKEGLLVHIDEYEWLARYKEMLSNPDYDVFYGAPALIVIFGKPNGLLPEVNCSLAAENLMLAACEMGLGTCWIGFAAEFLNTAEIRRELGIPEGYTAIAPIIVGRPAIETLPVPRESPEILFWDS